MAKFATNEPDSAYILASLDCIQPSRDDGEAYSLIKSRQLATRAKYVLVCHVFVAKPLG